MHTPDATIIKSTPHLSAADQLSDGTVRNREGPDHTNTFPHCRDDTPSSRRTRRSVDRIRVGAITMLKSLAAIIIAFLLLLGSPFDYPAYAQQQKPTSVTIVGDRGFRPFHFTSRGQCVGILVDLWALWSRKTDIKTTFSCDLDWSAALDEVRKGRADIVGGVIRSTDREVWLDFAGNVITTYFYVYFHPSLGAFKDIDTLPDTTPIGVVKDDYPEGVLRAKYPTHSVRAYDDHDALISAAIRKDVLAFVLEPEVADYYFAIKGQIPAPFKRASEPFSIEKLDAGVRKERRDVSYWVKVGLGRITAGERAAILRRWNYSSSTHRFQSVVDAISRHAYVAIGVCVFLAYCVLLAAVWLFSELLPVRCLAFERLLRESLRFSLTLGATKFELSLRGVLLLQMFTYRSHVVDRWLATVTQRAQANFQRITATISGTSYTPLPLILDGELLTADDSAILEREVRSKIRTAVVVSRAPVVLFGEGGAGKTSTALRFAEWVCGFGEQSALGWPILPVLIEEDLEFQDKDTDRAILLAVQGRLTALTEEPVDGEMTAYLLRERRVCVVLDGLSERSDRTRRVFQARQANYPLVLLIATSRFEQDECFAGVPVRSVQPTRIGGVHISTFLNRYLIDLKKRVLFSDSEFYEVCGRIALFTGNRDITPLFAKLFADLEVSRR